MLVTLAVGMSAPSASGWGPTETLCTFHADGRPEGFVLWETRHSFRWRRLQSARKPSPCPICPSATFSPPRSCLPRLQRLLCPRGAGGRGRGGQGLGPRSVQDHAPQLASALGMSLESGPSRYVLSIPRGWTRMGHLGPERHDPRHTGMCQSPHTRDSLSPPCFLSTGHIFYLYHRSRRRYERVGQWLKVTQVGQVAVLLL